MSDDLFKGAFTMFGTFRVNDDEPLPEMFEGLPLESDESGDYTMTFHCDPQSETVIARWNVITGELTLEREDKTIILATHNPDAFKAGVALLGHGRVVMWLGFMLRAVTP